MEDPSSQPGAGAGESQQNEACNTYPIDSKEQEKARRKQRKGLGVGHVVTKRKQIVEDHYDGCRGDLSSPKEDPTALLIQHHCNFDAEEDMTDADHNQCLMFEFHRLQDYPVESASVARAAAGGHPAPGRNGRAPLARNSARPGCKHLRTRNDWERNRIAGQCAFPYDAPWVPDCVARRDRRRANPSRAFKMENCRWASAAIRILFRTNRESAIKLRLLKLHVRWLHASDHTLKKLIGRVGVSQKVLGFIPEIAQTCRVCREWTKPGPDHVCSAESVDNFSV